MISNTSWIANLSSVIPSPTTLNHKTLISLFLTEPVSLVFILISPDNIVSLKLIVPFLNDPP
nr:MAG TPA: hypothetical protein [Podoviridae sp. ctY3D12]